MLVGKRCQSLNNWALSGSVIAYWIEELWCCLCEQWSTEVLEAYVLSGIFEHLDVQNLKQSYFYISIQQLIKKEKLPFH